MAYITGITGVALLHSPWEQNATGVLPGASRPRQELGFAVLP